MAARNLRVATEADVKPKKVKTLSEAAAGGDYRELLEAQRADIAKSLEEPATAGPARAALHRQLGLIGKELREMDASDDEQESGKGAEGDQPWDSSAI